MLFCPKNDSLEIPWFNHGVSRCLMDTVTTGVSAGFLLLFGSIQFCIYLKYATSIVDTVNAARRSKLYALQRFLLILVPMLASIRFMLLAYFYEDPALYGYMVSLLRR